MWMAVRVTAVAVLAVAAMVVIGHGGRVLDAVDAATALAGRSSPTPRGDGLASVPAVVAGVAGGAVAALVRPLDRAVGQVVTLLHELGHTVVAAAFGGRPRGIVLRHDASGHATARWVGRATPGRRFALAAVAFAGVPAAATATVVGARLLLLVGPEAVLWSLTTIGAVVAVLARSPWSLLIAGGLAALALTALRDDGAPVAAAVVAGVLVATAVKTTRDNVRSLRLPLRAGDDARVVGRHLHVPGRLVQLVQVTTAATASGWTVWLLVAELRAG